MKNQKIIAWVIIGIILLAFVCMLYCTAQAESYDVPLPEEMAAIRAEAAGAEPAEPFTWAYLATIAGASAFTLLIVQFFKVRLDRVWKIPTRVFVYFVALIIMLGATFFTVGITVESALLTACNAFLAAVTAYGAYELTFAKKE